MTRRLSARVAVATVVAVLLGWVPRPAAGQGTTEESRKAELEKDQCYVCHLQLDGALGDPARGFLDDVHAHRDLGCAGCHGGDRSSEDPEVAMSPKSGFVGKPTLEQVPRFCGRCHSNASLMAKFNPKLPVDQEEKYFTSVHGQRLKTGDTHVATCIGCHRAHDVRRASDPKSSVYPVNVPSTCAHCHSDPALMKPYGIPTNQYEDYAASVHGEALLKKGDTGAPACNSCHGNHGARPPDAETVGHACGICHAKVAENLARSTMAVVFRDQGIAPCTTCHSNHRIVRPSDDWIGNGPESKCTQCHFPGDAGLTEAVRIHEQVAGLDSGLERSTAAVREAEQKGMEVTEADQKLQAAREALIESRSVVHTFRASEVGGVVDRGRAAVAAADSLGRSLIHEYYFRRRGFALSSLIIAILAVALAFKIRGMERGSSAGVS